MVGAAVYQHEGEPLYYVCPVCFEKKEVQILQDRRVMSGHFDCPNPACKAQYPIINRKSGTTMPTLLTTTKMKS